MYLWTRILGCSETREKLSRRDRWWFESGGQQVVIAGDDHGAGRVGECDQVVVVWVAHFRLGRSGIVTQISLAADPAPEFRPDQHGGEFVEQMLGRHGSDRTVGYSLRDPSGGAVRVDYSRDPHVGVDDNPQWLVQDSARLAGRPLRSYRGQLFGGELRSFFLAGGLFGADTGPDPLEGLGESQVPAQRVLEDFVFAPARPCGGYLRCAEQCLVDVDGGFLSRHTAILTEKRPGGINTRLSLSMWMHIWMYGFAS